MIIAFWRPCDPYAYFGQWFESEFKLSKNIIKTFPEQIQELDLCKDRMDVLEKLLTYKTFPTAEKFMMMGKAALFNDDEIFEKMARSRTPAEDKKLGRLVKDFDDDTWEIYSQDIVKIGNYLKFSQNKELKEKIIQTKPHILVEGSPMDRIWGVGLRFDSPLIQDETMWRGKNYLGICLMFIRDIL
jgi:ribA/ribD-fused uncharacterized protein